MKLTNEERFAAATKVPAAEYDSVVFCKGGPPSHSFDEESEGFYADVQDLVDAFKREGKPLPEYAWACFQDVPETDVDWLIEDTLQEHHANAKGFITREHEEKLDAFLKQWWKESGAFTWRPDYTKAVLLGREG